MSRCFPFPPPGYERKHVPEDLDLLKEAKRKEKKHKKEKKDKERKKDKEKKDKGGIDEKQREKKDRGGKHKDKKEKHRDKKDRSKDKEKSSISEESSVSGKHEEKGGEKLHPRGHSKDKSNVVDEGKNFTLYQGQNGVKPSQSRMLIQGAEESKFVWDLERRINDDKSRGSQLPEAVSTVDNRNQEVERRAGVKVASQLLEEEKARAGVKIASRLLGEEKNDNKDTRGHYNKMDLREPRSEAGGYAMVQNLNAVSKSKSEGIPRLQDEQGGRRLHGEEKCRESGDNKRGDKRKDRDKINHGHEKEKEKDTRKEENDKKKEDKAKVKTENKKREEKLKEIQRKDTAGVTSTKSTDLLKDVNSSAEGDNRKRKDMDTGTNGFCHESEIGPSKMQRTAPHEMTQNGKTREVFPTPSEFCYENHSTPNSVGKDKVNRFLNGTIEVQKPSSSKYNPSAATMVIDQSREVPKVPLRDNETLILSKMEKEIAKASRRPPHPDSKYLQEVLTVPNVGDWPENDDQEWLFGKKDPSDTPKVKALAVNEERIVWSEARYIEAADICALPYVIPF